MLSFRQTLRFAPPLVLIAFMLAARAYAPSTPTTNLPVVAPTVAGSQGAVADIASVHAAPAFEVAMTKDIVYAQGLSHETWGSESAEAMDLLLDVYEPVRFDDAVMPAIVMIHGGGSTEGANEQGGSASGRHGSPRVAGSFTQSTTASRAITAPCRPVIPNCPPS